MNTRLVRSVRACVVAILLSWVAPLWAESTPESITLNNGTVITGVTAVSMIGTKSVLITAGTSQTAVQLTALPTAALIRWNLAPAEGKAGATAAGDAGVLDLGDAGWADPEEAGADKAAAAARKPAISQEARDALASLKGILSALRTVDDRQNAVIMAEERVLHQRDLEETNQRVYGRQSPGGPAAMDGLRKAVGKSVENMQNAWDVYRGKRSKTPATTWTIIGASPETRTQALQTNLNILDWLVARRQQQLMAMRNVTKSDTLVKGLNWHVVSLQRHIAFKAEVRREIVAVLSLALSARAANGASQDPPTGADAVANLLADVDTAATKLPRQEALPAFKDWVSCLASPKPTNTPADFTVTWQKYATAVRDLGEAKTFAASEGADPTMARVFVDDAATKANDMLNILGMITGAYGARLSNQHSLMIMSAGGGTRTAPMPPVQPAPR